MQAERETFYDIEAIAQNVSDRIEQAKEKGEPIDYLTFVPDGEPTLDAHLGREIDLLKHHGIKIAVITNASFLWRDDVREDLQKADLVSLKIDSINREVWRRINRPHKSLKLEIVLEGMLKFATIFKGRLITETMLIQKLNDKSEEIEPIASFLAELKPDRAYLAIPIRPPARRKVIASDEQSLNIAYQIFSRRLSSVEYLIAYEGNAFALTSDVADNLLGITSVHPMREEAVKELLEKGSARWETVEKLIEDGSLIEVGYQGRKFYMRRLPQHRRRKSAPS